MRLLPGNTYSADPALRSLLRATLSPAALDWAEPQLLEMGRLAAGELAGLAEAAESQPPRLRSFDAWGERVDEVVYGDAWSRIGAVAARAGCVSVAYEPPPEGVNAAEARVVQAALCYLFSPSSATYSCPVAMTDGTVRVLRDFGAELLRDEVVPHLIARDPEEAWTAGQWMTEQQGGSDVGANRVEARPSGGGWRLWGRKYFCSSVTSEVALVLARPTGAPAGTRGLGLFLVRWELPDGSRNCLRIDRLKDKLGTRAMATGEVTLEGAEAEPVGELEQGFLQMTPMLNLTRLHNALASAATIRRGLSLARCYATQREAFGQRLENLPLQRQVMLELAVRAEGSLALVLRLAELQGRVENGLADEPERLLFRLGTSMAKLFTAKEAVAAASEAIECFGGAGYMEDTGLGRLLRDAQILPIWEGTTNVLSLDVGRVLTKPGVVDAFGAEMSRLGRTWRPQQLDGDADLAQRQARRAAFAVAREWIEGLLEERQAESRRAELVAQLWSEGVQPSTSGGDAFDLVVDGV